ncbi:MAG: hypothetical protein QOF76_3378 [Solirubrobacteraceae bacterium]|nr:hypothetical protein [Solirubrobacteraceae bacterium]
MRPGARAAVIVLSAALAALGLAADAGGPLRVLATAWFVLGCPALALGPLVDSVAGAGAVRLALGAGAATLVLTALLLTSTLTAWTGWVVIVDLCAVACALDWWFTRAALPRDDIRVHAR